MALALIPLVIAGATWLSRIGLAVFAVNEIKKLISDNRPTLEAATTEAEKGGLSADEQRKMATAVTFEQVEAQGKNVDEWWGSLTPSEQQALKFSPESLRADTRRTTFLGTAQTLLWIAAGVALARAGFKGLPVSVKGLADIAALKQKGASASVIANELAILKTAILNKTWIPGSAAGILATGGWIAGGLMNNLNDATLWGRIFLDQAHSDVEKAAANAAKGEAGAGSGSSGTDLPKTIIRMVTEEKPQQFIGTLFSSKLGSAEQFERHIDDKITDIDDLEADVKLNLNRWLASLPNRMGYSIVVRKDPVDEYGAQQSGIWATLTLFITHISGKTTPIDTILLGPVEPAVRLELARKTTTVENHIAGFIQAATVKEIQIPAGSVDIFNAQGERVTPSTVAGGAPANAGSTPAASTQPATPAAPASPQETIKTNMAGFSTITPPKGAIIYNSDGSQFAVSDGVESYGVQWWNAAGKRWAMPSTPTPTNVGTPAAPSTPTSASSYVVKSGDTLGAIAQKFGVAISDISGYRSGNPNLIYPGETLTIRTRTGTVPLP